MTINYLCEHFMSLPYASTTVPLPQALMRIFSLLNTVCISNYATQCYDLTMGRIYKTRNFSRWMRKTGLTDLILCGAVIEMKSGLFDADLGGNVLKKRVALPGRGKSGGTRTLVATNRGSRWIFVFGFEKNERDNINAAELEALQKLAHDYLSRPQQKLDVSLANGDLMEICNDK